MRRTTFRCLGVLALAAPLAVGCSTTIKTTTVGGTPVSSAHPSAGAGPSATPSAAASPAANPLAKLSGTAALARSRAAALAASSAHVSGTGTDSGQKVTLNIRVGRTAARSAFGTITLDGAPLQVRYTGGSVYLRSTAAGWRAFAKSQGEAADADAIADLFGSRWGKLPAASSKDFLDLLELEQLVGNTLPPASAAVENRGIATVGGQRVVVLAQPGGSGRIDVAAAGQPYPLVVSDDTGTLRYDSWNAPVRVAAPPAADTIAIPAS